MEIKGLTGAGVLLVALLGGAAGGVLVTGGHDTDPPAVVFDQAAQSTEKINQAKRAEAAAKRAEKMAKRAEAAAVRAEKAARQDTVPVATPECEEGTKRGVPYHHNGNFESGAGQSGEDTCIGGKWVRTKEPVDAPPLTPPDPTPAP